MPFLAISCFLMYANLFAAARYFARRETPRTRRLAGVHMIACALMGIAFLVGTELLVFDHEGGIAGDAFNWTPAFYLASSVLSTVLFAYKLYQKAQEGEAGGGRNVFFGLTLWAVLAGLYIGATTIDHFLFFRDRNNTGQMDVAFSGEPMNCSGDVLLVRVKNDTAEYRCPQSIRLGRDYSTPFVPWPSYIEGTSTRLKHNIDIVTQQGANGKDVIAVPSSDLKVMPNVEQKGN